MSRDISIADMRQIWDCIVLRIHGQPEAPVPHSPRWTGADLAFPGACRLTDARWIIKKPVRHTALRLVALIVLLSGAADYCAFDLSDPLAPMSASGTPSAIVAGANRHMTQTSIRLTDTQDDRCICCAAGFPAHPIVLRGAAMIAIVNHVSVLRPCDPQLVRFDPPPRA
jgi:hypothetical protein